MACVPCLGRVLSWANVACPGQVSLSGMSLLISGEYPCPQRVSLVLGECPLSETSVACMGQVLLFWDKCCRHLSGASIACPGQVLLVNCCLSGQGCLSRVSRLSMAVLLVWVGCPLSGASVACLG